MSGDFRLPPEDDPALVTAAQAAAAEAGSASEFEALLRSRGWPVEVAEHDELTVVGDPALMTRKAPALRDVTVIRQWAGMYDVTPDHLAVVGPTSQLEGWWQANGWSGRGMLLAPFLTELLAEHLVTGRAPAMLASFLPDRFSPDDPAAPMPTDYYARYGSRSSPSVPAGDGQPRSDTSSSGTITSSAPGS